MRSSNNTNNAQKEDGEAKTQSSSGKKRNQVANKDGKSSERKQVIKKEVNSSDGDSPIFSDKRVRHPPRPIKIEIPEGADTTLMCGKCNKLFPTAEELSKHEGSCFVGRRYPCPWKGCTHENAQRSLMRQHYKAVHLNDPFVCPHCSDRTFIYLKAMKKHIKNAHTRKGDKFKYNCDKCEFRVDDKTEFQVHYDKHTDVKRFKCNLCDKTFASQSQMTKHSRECKAAKVEKPKKKANVVTVASLKAALQDREVKFECTVCVNKGFPTEDEYREHFKTLHVDTVEGTVYYCEKHIIRMFTVKMFEAHAKVCDKYDLKPIAP